LEVGRIEQPLRCFLYRDDVVNEGRDDRAIGCRADLAQRMLGEIRVPELLPFPVISA
jgi:hypothetical protein